MNGETALGVDEDVVECLCSQAQKRSKSRGFDHVE